MKTSVKAAACSHIYGDLQDAQAGVVQHGEHLKLYGFGLGGLLICTRWLLSIFNASFY